MNGELVEAVAKVIDDTYDVDCCGEMLNLDDVARAVIPVVQAHERERCAKVAEDAPTPWDGDSTAYHANCIEAGGFSNGLDAAAAAIRGLGE